MRKLHLKQRGDTLVEVILALAVLNAILFISWGITNRSTQQGLNARRRIEMVNLLKEQAELLKAGYANADTVQSKRLVPGALPFNQIDDAAQGNAFCDEDADLQ